MDPIIGKWIIEFLARQPVDDRTLNELVATLPLPLDDFDLKKTLLLRSIQSEFTSGDVSERLLHLMELMSELEFREGKVASVSLKEAYCNVAVDCTVRFLDKDLEYNEKYSDTLKRIWWVRASAMENLENSGLVSEKLLKWKDDLEAAACDVELRGKILSRNTRHEALNAVARYIAEAWDDMGPSFIEKSAVTKIGDIGDGVEDVERSAIVNNADLRPLPDDTDLVSSEYYTDGDSEYPVPSELLDAPVREASENQVSEVVESAFLRTDGMIGEGVEGVQLSEIAGNVPVPDESMVYSNEFGIDGDGDGVRSSDLHEEFMDVTSENRVFEVVEKAFVNDGMISGGGPAVDGENSRGKARVENETSVEEPQRDKHLSETQGIAAMTINDINIVNNPVGNQGGNIEFMDVTSENRVFEVAEKAFVLNVGMVSGGGSAVDGENSRVKDRVGNDTSVEEPQRNKYLSETQGIASMTINEINIVNNPAGNQGGNLVTPGTQQSFLPHGTSGGIRPATGKGAQVRTKHSAFRTRVKGHRHAAPAKIADVDEMDEHVPEVSPVQEGVGSGNKEPLPDTSCMERAKSIGIKAQNVHSAVKSPIGKRREQAVNDPGNNVAADRKEDLGEGSSGASLKHPHPQYATVKKKKRRFWTPLEEDTLRTGVKKFGKGNWKLILNAYSEVFQDRTEVNLKDKWRNMNK